MNFILQLQYTIKRMLLDLRPLLNKLISGIIVILILGVVFQSSFSAKNLKEITLLYVNEDEGIYSQQIIKGLETNENLDGIVVLKEADSMESGKQLVEDKKASGLLVFASDFSSMYENDPAKCQLNVYCRSYTGENNNTDGKLVKRILDSYVDILSAVKISYVNNPEFQDEDIGFHQLIEQNSVVNKEKSSSMQYYAIAMLIMLILTGMIDGGNYIAEEYFGSIGARIKVSPMKQVHQYMGKIVGVNVMVVLEALFMVLFTNIFYGVYWGSHFGWLLLIIISTALLSTSLGATITIVLGTDIGVEIICPTIVYASTFLSGGYIAHDFGFFKYITPNHYAKVAINTLIYGGEMNIVYRQFGILLVVTAIVAEIGVIVAERRKA